MGSSNNYKEFFLDQLNFKIKILKDEQIFDPTRDEVLESIKEFQKIELPEFDDLPNVFTHNDLALQNWTVNDDSLIEGIIDWEWSGSYPICEEYISFL